MVKEIIIPRENIAKTEEVRALENKDLAQPAEQQPITETVKEAVLPVAHASDKDEQKEGTKQVLG